MSKYFNSRSGLKDTTMQHEFKCVIVYDIHSLRCLRDREQIERSTTCMTGSDR